jgi:hypothetical protein
MRLVPTKKSSEQFDRFAGTFGSLLKQVHREGPDAPSIQERYPPDVYARAEQFCENLTKTAFEQLKAGKKARLERHLSEELFLEMLMESDRGCVLIASSAIEDIGKAFVEYLLCSGGPESAKAGKRLISGMAAPLGTAWSREVFLFAVGAIYENEVKAMEALRDLRNTYAHQSAPATLTEKQVNAIHRHLVQEDQAKVDIMGSQIGGFMEVVSSHDLALSA